MSEEEPQANVVGVVEHYYPKVQVAVVNVQRGVIHRGDRLRIVGNGVDFEEVIQSLERDHEPIRAARPGESVGIQVSERVRENNQVFLVRK